jgi:DNA-binding NarL/FixJ family response regulator
MPKVLIADDHTVVRRGVENILREAFDDVVCGEAQNVAQVLDLVRQQEWTVVVLDLNLPGRSGLEGLKELKRERPKLPVLVFTMYPEEQFGVRACEAGADGYLIKGSAPQELVTAIKRIVSGRKYFSPAVVEKLAAALARESEKLLHETLSNREYEVLCKIASGKTVSAIARELSASVKTVSTYRTRLLKKMGMSNNAELTAYAIRNQLVD